MEPILCANGCGFYGSAGSQNLCSKCYTEYLESKQIAKATTESLIADVDHGRDPLPTAMVSENEDAVAEVTAQLERMTLQRVKNRCKSCNKKVGLTGFKCRCGGLFCGRHRMPEQHACGFNYKASYPNEVNGSLPLIKGDKLKWRI